MNKLIELNNSDLLGNVTYVDTSQVIIEIDNPNIMGRISVGNLIAIETGKKHQLLISLIEKVTRKYIDDFDDTDEDEQEIMVSSADYVKVNIIRTYYTVFGEKKNIFKRGVDVFPQIESKSYCLVGTNLQNFMNLLSNSISSEKKLDIGKFIMDGNARASLDGNKFFQKHAAVLGSTGSGKSWCVANILEKANQLEYSNILVFDMHGEYKSLTNHDSKIAEYYKIAGPGDLEDSDENILFLPYWLLNREELLSMILDRSDSNAPNQSSRFTLHIRELKEKTLINEGKEDVTKTFTVDSPIPFEINELISKLVIDDTKKGVGSTGKPVKGEWEGKLTRFISRLNAKVSDKTYGFMFQPNKATLDYGWLSKMLSTLIGHTSGKKGIKIVDFSEVPSDILPIVTGTLARLLYDIQFWMVADKRTPFALICDEAHLYLPIKDEADSTQKQALYNFERIAKEGRKYGVSLVPVSQRPSDISKTILSQCNNFVVLRLTNDRDKSVIKNLLPDTLKSTIDLLPLLDVGEALVVGDAILLPSRILLDKPSVDHRPVSATRDFWDDWDTLSQNNENITEAVEAVRKQSRAKN
ncbi:ATP-binding protein [Enterococcus camelliae]|uniref:ATP-binding protein n=1 Tax=Enterococcus camelliae TaxID=453959 RepID=A0ABW5TLZ9_9ENTE